MGAIGAAAVTSTAAVLTAAALWDVTGIRVAAAFDTHTTSALVTEVDDLCSRRHRQFLGNLLSSRRSLKGRIHKRNLPASRFRN